LVKSFAAAKALGLVLFGWVLDLKLSDNQ